MRLAAQLILTIVPALLLTVAPAQQLTADEVLDRIKTEAEGTEDASFLLTGRLIDPDGTAINLEIEVEVIPGANAARAFFIQPDALADNFIVFDDDTVYNYIFLTNQVTLFDADDPDALGGFFGDDGGAGAGGVGADGDDAGGFSLTIDLDELFADWDAAVDSYEEGSYRLRLDNRDEDGALDHVFATVAEGTWVPSRLELIGEDGRTVAELFIQNFTRDQGLSVEDVTWIPEDAEVIDERD